jgi:regulator of protease activity HflC (stomatin/prohibitin superfamily)
MDQVEVYDTEVLGRLVIGYIPTGEQDNIWTQAHGGEEYRLLLGNGDELISVNLEIEYKISDLYSYVSSAAGPEALLQAEAYEIITERTITSNLETMLSTNREEFSESFRAELTEHMAHYNTGLDVVNVVLESIHPPVEVADVYQALIGASIDAEHLIIQAQNKANQTIMDSKNEQTAKVGDAKVQSYQAVAEAQASVSEFMASVAAYESYPAAYRYYKYMNTLAAAYGQARLVLVGTGVDAEKLFIGSLDKVETEEDYQEQYDEQHAFDEEY